MIRERAAQILLILSGVVYGLVALTMLATPEWFYNNIGNHPPYNRHYVGDLGAFQLGLAAGLIVAAWNPARNRVLIGAAAIAGIVHTLNHGYDMLLGEESLGTVLQLAVLAAVLIVTYALSAERTPTGAAEPA